MNNENINVCLLNFEAETNSKVQQDNYNVFEGSVGTKVQIEYGYDSSRQCKENYKLPKNLHEFSFIALNMNDGRLIPYRFEDHQSKELSNVYESKFVIQRPTNVFNPKPIGTHYLNIDLLKHKSEKRILVVFASQESTETFFQVKIGGSTEEKRTFKASNYEFLNKEFLKESKNGKLYTIAQSDSDKTILNLLEKYEDLEYHQTFNNIDNDDCRFLPLMYCKDDEIISFLYEKDNLTIFLFPDIKQKSSFLLEFLNSICPDYLPNLFSPNINNWLDKEEYWLPEYDQILEKRNTEIARHRQTLVQIDQKIEKNKVKYGFLHDLITETGDKLVNSVVHVLTYIGFQNIKKVDDMASNGLFEEDIQLIHDDKTLVIEVKGITGTSKDSECSQISKIRFRRMKESKSTEIYALYIVNNERHKPPLSRKNPPFNQIQISDALNDDRGLLTTTTLFNLYYALEEGALERSEVKNMFFNYGLISFLEKLRIVGKIEKTYSNNSVASVNVQNIKIKVDDIVYSEHKGRLKRHKIKSLQQNKIDFQEVETGITGILLDPEVIPRATLYKK